jgi:Arm DNA-binding domain
MATVNLTARYLDLLKPQRKRYEVFDTIVPGFAIRVTPAGHKSFTLYYRHHGRIRRVGLGRYPDILLADARKAATQHRGRIFDGADPAEEKKAERATNGDTVGALFDLYKRIGRRLRAGRRRDGLWNARSCRSGGISAWSM